MDSPHVFIRDSLPGLRRPPTARVRDRSLPLAILGLALAAVPPIGRALAAQVTELRTAALLPPDAVVGAVVLGAGLLTALWYAATGIGLILAALIRRDLGVARWGAPLARRLALGAGLGLLAITPAHAEAPDDLSWGTVATLDAADLAADLTGDGAPVPPLAVATPAPAFAAVAASVAASVPASVPAAPPATGASVPAAPPAAAADPVVEPAAGHPATHVVAAGECLWEIVEDHLAEPTDARIAQGVADWVAANPALAENPDLIHPGDVLTVPDGARS